VQQVCECVWMHVYVSYSHQGTQQAVVQQACVHGFNCARLHALSFCKRASLHPSGRCLSDCISHVHHYPPNQHMMHHIRCKVFISCKLLHSNHTCTHTYKHSHTHMHARTHAHTHTHTYTNTHTQEVQEAPRFLRPPVRSAAWTAAWMARTLTCC